MFITLLDNEYPERFAPGATGCLPASVGAGTEAICDRVELEYNRQGQLVWKKDQNGTIHQFDYDDLGRQTQDRVTTVGSGVDDAVLRLGTSYEVRGQADKITSYDNATAGSGSAVNQVVFEYDDVGLLSKEYQEHAGAKGASTLYVQYNHDTSASSGRFTKGLRATSVRYPNGRLVHYTYGTSSGMGDSLNRLNAIKDDNAGSPGNTLASYSYLGQNTIVIEDYEEPDVRLEYFSGGTYSGFDRFGRVIDQKWHDYGASADRDRFTYGHDRASNRIYREHASASGLDEFYTYDGINRLVTFDRGELNTGKTAIIGTPGWQEDWSLDPTGNWTVYTHKTSGTTDLDQARTQNAVNEITTITATTGTNWADPIHDRAGNMTTIPKPADLANGLTAKYDAWNRLVELKDGATIIATYEYDPQHRRTKQHLDSAAPSSPDGLDTYIHYFHSHSWQTLETRHTTTSSVQPETLQPKHQYLHSPRYIDSPILRDENTDQDSLCDDQRLYYLNDANFNMTTLVDQDGDVVERYVYDPYGKVTICDSTWQNTRSASGYANPVLYTGRELDCESGVMHYRTRYFSTEVGRFVSRDLVGYADGASLYRAYFAPSRLDPLGMCVCCCCPESLATGKITVGMVRDPNPNAPPRFKFVFRVNASMRMTEEMAEPGGMCKIEWHECPNADGSLGQKRGKWFRAPSPSDDPPGGVTSNWNDPPASNCSGKFTRFWQDSPTILQARGARVDIKFAVRVTAGPGCECGGSQEATLFFGLHAEVQIFNNLFPGNVVFSPNPPVLTPGLGGQPKACTRANVPW